MYSRPDSVVREAITYDMIFNDLCIVYIYYILETAIAESELSDASLSSFISEAIGPYIYSLCVRVV